MVSFIIGFFYQTAKKRQSAASIAEGSNSCDLVPSLAADPVYTAGATVPVAVPLPPIPLHIRLPYPPAAVVDAGLGVMEVPSTTSTLPVEAKLYCVPDIVTADAPGAMVCVPMITTLPDGAEAPAFDTPVA